MARSYRYLHYDVFTDRLFGGNQLAVVLDGRGLSTNLMQAIAHEMNFSETTFVLPAERPDTDFRLRIFTPSTEMPMAGHPTIGSAYALARGGLVDAGRDGFVFGLNVGPTPVSLTWTDRELSFAWMTQQRPVFSAPVASPGDAARAIGVPSDAVTSAKLPVQVVSCGVPYLFIPLATREAVDAATSRADAIDAYSKSISIDASGVLLFSCERGDDSATVYSRMFAPGLGVGEDPATGSAAGPLGCYLVRHKMVPAAQVARIVDLQGVKMGRPSVIHVAVGLERDEIVGVRVGGDAVLAGEGVLYIP
jgi:trans-2,3-dihydro-3-hydroxyanthranilate isomerase